MKVFQVRGSRLWRSRPRRYMIALASVLVQVLVRLLLTPVFGDQFRFMMFLPAVVFSAWYGGLGAGLAATAFSTVAATYFWSASSSAVAVNSAEDMIAFCLFVLMGGFVSLLSENLIQARRRLESSLVTTEQRACNAALAADVGAALTSNDSAGRVLQCCAAAIVRRLDAAFARIWVLNGDTDVLELQASAGMYTHLDGKHSCIPVGQFKIGMIAAERKPHLTNAVLGDPRITDQEWARREGVVAFAGYPLVVGERLVGVVAMFARSPLSEVTLQALGSVADEIAVDIERRRAEAALRSAYETMERRVQERTAELQESNARLREEIAGHERAEEARRESESRLRELQKVAQQRERLADIGAITAQIAHDLGNPLGGLALQMQQLLRRARRDERQPVSAVIEPLERVLADVRRLEALIREFMDFTREQRLESKPLNLSRFLQGVVEAWQPVAAEHGISIRAEMADDGLLLSADDEKRSRSIEHALRLGALSAMVVGFMSLAEVDDFAGRVRQVARG